MTVLTSPEEMAALLLAGGPCTILTHRRPDGDTVGSAIALCRGLRAAGAEAAIYENPQFTPRYLPYLAGLTAQEVHGTVVAVDTASEGLFPMGFSGHVTFCIDHHGSNTGYADRLLLGAGKASCGEIVLELLPLLGVRPDRAMADALYIAVSTDTGCFRYSNTKADTLRAAASLVELGADTPALNRMLFEVKSRARLLLESYLAADLKTYAGGVIGVCALPQAEMERLGANEDDADSIAGFARNLEGVEIGVLLRDLPGNQCKISLRTNDRLYNASEICRTLGGGGHSAAAGATVPGSLEEGRETLLAAIAAQTKLVP